MSVQSRWVRFTLNHPWLSAAMGAAVAGLLIGTFAPEGAIVGVVFGVILFLVVGLGQSWQTGRASDEEKASGKVADRRGPFGRWVRSHPWISGAVGG